MVDSKNSKIKTRKGFFQHHFLFKKTKAGFTLIEVMMVVTIIGILATALGWGAYRNSIKRSRDGKRKADLEQIRTALEMYRADVASYPSSLGSLTSGGYIDAIPSDPLPTKRSYSYVRTTTISYNLCAALELETGSGSGCGSCTVSCNYKRTNP